MTETLGQRNTRLSIADLYNRELLTHSPQLRMCRHLVAGQKIIRPWRYYGSAISSTDTPERIIFIARSMAQTIEDHLHGRNTANESLDAEDKAGLVCLTPAPMLNLQTRVQEPKRLFQVLSESPQLNGSMLYFVGAQFSTLGEGYAKS